ncbi:hypothetical protein KZZ52_27740 [Dactylosporangium sp. AC04546]|uniref:hypothetical protein n=1 Tax=Dactylosporangium sp. AC04546 TaxID=2862460 RepID=UPI001EE0F3D0|nr:hypothetical protein [Dactylosporangium sp. AC04546]WVK89059.1 hypothetical protein KZZ52_27740 [Dactylosporangium sp. AC04546]
MVTTVTGLHRRAGVRVAVALLALVVTAGAAVLVARLVAPGGFLTRDHDRLMLGGREYRYTGQTVPGLIPCGQRARSPQDAELDAFFAALPPRSMVRTWATETAPLPDIERVVAAAARHGQLLTLVLATGDGTCPDTDLAAADRPERPADWYRDGHTASYLPWLRTLAGRFRDEPAVAVWELVDAPRAGPAPDDLRRFSAAAADALHRAAPHQLVAAGGPADSPGVDVVTLTDFDMTPGTLPYLGDALGRAWAAGKPLVLADVGLLASRDGDTAAAFDAARPAQTRCVSWTQRVRTLRAKLDASFTAGVAGVAVRGWRPGTPVAGCTVGNAGWSADPLLDFLRGYRPPAGPLTRMAAAGATPSPAPASPAAPGTSPGATVTGPVPSVPGLSAGPAPGSVPGPAATTGPAPLAVAAAITVVGTPTVVTDPGTGLTHRHTLPSAVRAGDQLIAAVELYDGEPVPSVAGFTLVAAATGGDGYRPRTLVFRRTAQAGDTAVVVTFGDFAAETSTVVVYRGVDPAAPVVAVTTGYNDGSATVSVPGLSAPAGSRLVLVAGVCSNETAGAWTGASAGMTLRAGTSARPWTGLAVFDQTAGGGATGSRTVSRDGAAHQSGVLLALRRA